MVVDRENEKRRLTLAKNFSFLIFPAYLAALVLIALLPLNGPGSGMEDVFVLSLRLDYLLHGVMFVPFICLARRSPYRHFPGFLLLISALAFAAFCEIIQWPLSYRAFNVNDLVANLAGVLVGWLLFILFR